MVEEAGQGITRSGIERWWQEHSELDRLVADVKIAMTSGSTQTADAALEELFEALEAHFKVEEDVYFPLIEKTSDRHTDVLRGARLGHRRIRESLEDVRSLVERAEFAGAERSLAILLDHFRAHEDAETQLIRDLETLGAS